VDLDRLKIPERTDPPRTRRWITPVVAASCLLVGYLLGRSAAPEPLQQPTTNSVTSAASSARSAPPGFTTGGWVEVSTPEYPIYVTSRVSERLEELHVKEGDTVAPGQIVAKTYDADLRSRLGLAEARMQLAEKTYEKLKAGFRKEDVDAAKARVAETSERVRIAKANYDRSRKLLAGAISAQELDEQLSRLTEASATHALAEAELAKLAAGSRTEDVAIAQARFREMSTEVELAKRMLSYAEVKAPQSDAPLRVLEVRKHVGDWINVRTSPEILALYDPQEMQVRVDVTQSKIKLVRPSGRATIMTEADRTRQYTGRVLRIEPLAVLAKNTITVRIRIDDPDEYLFPEMVAQVTFAPESDAAPPGAEQSSEATP
jgi:multidrug resistance efflux pump